MIISVICILISILLYINKKKWKIKRPLFYPPNKFIIIGHRGAPTIYKENTIESFIKAFELGLNGVELDVQITKDNKIVIFHDWYILDKNNENAKQISNINYSEIADSSYSNSKIPLLNDLLKVIPKNKFVNIEIKSKKINNYLILKEILKIVYEHNKKESIIISSFNPFVLKLLQKIAPTIHTAYLWSSKDPLLLFNSLLWIYLCHPDVLHIDINDANRKIVNWAHKKKLAVLAFTVNDTHELYKARKINLDGIFTDNPKLQK